MCKGKVESDMTMKYGACILHDGQQSCRHTLRIRNTYCSSTAITVARTCLNLLKPTDYVMHQQFNIQQLYALPTLYLCVLYLSENKQRLVPLTA